MRGSLWLCVGGGVVGAGFLGCVPLGGLSSNGGDGSPDFDAPSDAGPSSDGSSSDAPTADQWPTDGTPSDDGGGCSADLSTDSRNCGACGHDCRGAACAARVCAPTVIAQGLDGPAQLLVDATNVYFSTSGGAATSALLVCPLAGCAGTPTVLATGAGSPIADIAMDATNLYWVSNFSLMSCAKNGCSNPSKIASAGLRPSGLALDAAGNIYWSDIASGLMTCLISNCAATMAALFNYNDQPAFPAVYNGQLFWASEGVSTQAIEGCTLTSCNAPINLAGANSPAGLTVDGVAVYWTEGNLGAVRSVPPSGGNTSVLATVQNNPRGMASDGAFVYWANGGGTIMRVPVAGGALTVLASGQSSPLRVALDAEYVYWTNQGQSGQLDGSVLRVAK
jgi:hypothetical protein